MEPGTVNHFPKKLISNSVVVIALVTDVKINEKVVRFMLNILCPTGSIITTSLGWRK